MTIDLFPALGCLIGQFAEKGVELFAVGGYVRNTLLGLPAGDVDICAGATPDVLEGLSIPGVFISPRAYGLGTVCVRQVFGAQEFHYEYTAFRRDSYRPDGSHAPEKVSFTQSMQQDAQRRDFTIGALYAGAGGKVIDPTGRGLADLEKKRIAQVSADTLKQDALRILRAVRFACTLGFDVQERTWRAALQNARKLENISMERIRDEFLMIVMADRAYDAPDAVLRGLMMLRDLGVLEYILPDMEKGQGFVQIEKYHAYDVLDHGIHSCACAPPDLTVRLAALLHDVAKPDVYARDGTMHSHGRQGSEMAAAILRRLKLPKAITAEVSQLVGLHMFDLDNSAKDRAVMRMITKIGKEQFLRLCALREADFCGSGRGLTAQSAYKWREVLAKLEAVGAPIGKDQLAVSGHDIQKELGMGPGRQIGEILSALHTFALKKPKQNNYTSLIRYAKMIGTQSARQGSANDTGDTPSEEKNGV